MIRQVCIAFPPGPDRHTVYPCDWNCNSCPVPRVEGKVGDILVYGVDGDGALVTIPPGASYTIDIEMQALKIGT